MTHVSPPAPPPAIDLEQHQVLRAQRGDATAFRWLFDRYAPSIRRFSADLLRDTDAADECTQETFVRAHRQLAGLREPEKWRTWLFSTAHFVALEQRRKQQRTVVSTEDAPDRVDGAATPEAALLGREADRVIDEALLLIDEPRRAALLLRVDHGLPYEAIAEVLGWSVAKAKVEVHRARLELRERVGAYVEGES